MSKENGFVPIRRGLWEHVRDGRMSVTEALAFIYICSQADTRTGIWKGCAKALSGEVGIPERTARDVLEKMEHGDYIRRFAVPGSHLCYPILVHKFPLSQGEHNGEQVNALGSRSPADLAYFSREQSVEQDGEHGVEHGAAQRRQDTRDRRQEKNPAARPRESDLPLADGFEQFWTAYPKKVDKPAAIRAWRKVKPEEADAILARVELNKVGEWAGKEKQFIANPATWLNGRRWTDEILSGGRGNGKAKQSFDLLGTAAALGFGKPS